MTNAPISAPAPNVLPAPSGLEGRLGLPGWWIAAVVTVGGTFLLPRFANPASILMEVILWLWFLAASVRRSHDVDKHGVIALLGLFGVWVLTLVVDKSLYSALPIGAGIGFTALLAPLALDEGTRGPNQYGEVTWKWLWVGPARP